MYNQPEIILEQYDLEVRQITRGRGTYICDTSQGWKLLVPFRGSAERALFLREILGLLEGNGFPVEQICLTRDGAAAAEDENGVRYWLKDLVAGTECSTGRRMDMAGALVQLAMLHEMLAKCSFTLPEYMKSEPGEFENRCGRHYRELVRMKNYVQARKSKNDFDRCFQKVYPHFIQEAKEAIVLLEKLDMGCWQGMLCHGDFNQHNVVKTPEGIRIINFENMCCQSPVWDLANFLRKMLEKNQWDISLGLGLLEAYDRKRPLSEEERSLLYPMMLFPEKFWKIVNHYGSSHKAWVSRRDIEKLNIVVETELARERFLEKLFSFL